MDISKENSLIFNTHAFVKKLVASGMPEAQAEAQMEIFIQFIDDKLATKASLQELELALKAQMKILEKDIVIKLGGMIVIGVTALGAMIKFF
tara:strand:+ start:542 stop:817 length:276 start_codon:yes stop_codon:yes gene_type:complete